MFQINAISRKIFVGILILSTSVSEVGQFRGLKFCVQQFSLIFVKFLLIVEVCLKSDRGPSVGRRTKLVS
jgi:hypothetical protein